MSQESEQTAPQALEEAHQNTRMESFLLRLGTMGELFALLLRGGRWWMLPMIAVFVLLGLILVLLQSVQYVAPFIYMVF